MDNTSAVCWEARERKRRTKKEDGKYHHEQTRVGRKRHSKDASMNFFCNKILSLKRKKGGEEEGEKGTALTNFREGGTTPKARTKNETKRSQGCIPQVSCQRRARKVTTNMTRRIR